MTEETERPRLERVPLEGQQAGIPTAPGGVVQAGIPTAPGGVVQAGIPTAPGGVAQAGIPTAPGRSPNEAGAAPARPRARAPDGRDPLLSALLDGSRRLGRYRVLRLLGRGGMGTVFEAHDEQLDRKVAIKLLHTDIAQRHEERLRQEARALAQLTHPHVVQIYGTGEIEGRLFIAMELVEGQPLAKWHAQPRPWAECVEAYVQAARGLAAAHAKGLVHRDFNPSNCIIDATGRVRVLDFGLAIGLAAEPSTEDPQRPRLTETGAVLGTLAYMAFERLQGKSADAKSDQFSVCVSLHEALYGERPFEGAGAYELILALEGGHVRAPPAGRTVGRTVPGALRRVVLRGLARDPAERWPTMDALIEALERVVQANPRRGWLVLGGGTIAIAALSWALWPARPEPCEGSRERLQGIWDDDARARAEAAVLGTGVAYAPETWERLAPVLDDYAGAWVQGHHEACAATRIRGEQTEAQLDERMRCLDVGRRELAALSEMLVAADAGIVRSAAEAAHGLPSIGPCGDLEHLGTQQPLPQDPELRRAIEDAEVRLARAEALVFGGRHSEGLELATQVDAEAAALGHGPLVARAAYTLGGAHRETGSYPEAIEALERSYFEAKRWGLVDEAARAAMELVYLYGYRQGQYARAEKWIEHARADARAASDARLEANLSRNEAIFHVSQGDFERAEPHFEAAVRTMEQAVGPNDLAMATVLRNLANFYGQIGRGDQALEILARTLALEEDVLGPHHPSLAGTLSNLGVIRYGRREMPAARDAFSRALELAQQVAPEGSPSIARDLDFLANAQLDLGQTEQAQRSAERGLAMRQRLLSPTQRELAMSHHTLARIHRARDELDEAIEHDRAALAIERENNGAKHPFAAQVLMGLADAECKREEFEACVRDSREALDVFTRSYGPEHPTVAASRVTLASALLLSGDAEGALEQLERGEPMLAKEDLWVRAQAQFLLAQAWVAAGRDLETARAHAQQARELYGAEPEAHAQRLAEIDRWLGEHPDEG